MSSVLALKAFKKDFGLPTASTGFASKTNAQVSQNVVSLLTAGCFFGAIGASIVNDKFGRKRSLIGFTCIFLIGAAIQVASHHHIGQIYAGRVIAGLGIGGMSSITPVFVAENCPPAVRGRITGLFQEFLVIGSTFAYWLDYGVALTIPESTKQWRVPVAIQLIPGGALLIGVFFLKESPRWLAKQGRYEEATASLAYMRREEINDPDIVKEIADIRASIEEELAITEGVTWKEVLLPGNRYRFAVAFTIFLCQQFSGTNSIGYYAPQIFETIGVAKTNASLFATGVYGSVKVATTGLFLLIGIDKIGRRNSLLGGALWMMTMMFSKLFSGQCHCFCQVHELRFSQPPEFKLRDFPPLFCPLLNDQLLTRDFHSSWWRTPYTSTHECQWFVSPSRILLCFRCLGVMTFMSWSLHSGILKEPMLTSVSSHSRLPSIYRHGRHDLPLRYWLLSIMGSHPMGLCF